MIGEHRTLGKQDVLLTKLGPMWTSFRGRYCNLRRDLSLFRPFPSGTVVKSPPAMQETCRKHRFDPWVGKIPWRRKWQPTPVFFPGKSHGQKAWGVTVHGVAEWTQLSMRTAQWKTSTPGAPRAKSTPFSNCSCFLLTSATPECSGLSHPPTPMSPFPAPIHAILSVRPRACPPVLIHLTSHASSFPVKLSEGSVLSDLLSQKALHRFCPFYS